MAKINLSHVPNGIKEAVEREYPNCECTKALAAQLGLTLGQLQNIAHALHVPRSKAARGRVSSRAATMNRFKAFHGGSVVLIG